METALNVLATRMRQLNRDIRALCPHAAWSGSIADADCTDPVLGDCVAITECLDSVEHTVSEIGKLLWFAKMSPGKHERSQENDDAFAHAFPSAHVESVDFRNPCRGVEPEHFVIDVVYEENTKLAAEMHAADSGPLPAKLHKAFCVVDGWRHAQLAHAVAHTGTPDPLCAVMANKPPAAGLGSFKVLAGPTLLTKGVEFALRIAQNVAPTLSNRVKRLDILCVQDAATFDIVAGFFARPPDDCLRRYTSDEVRHRVLRLGCPDVYRQVCTEPMVEAVYDVLQNGVESDLNDDDAEPLEWEGELESDEDPFFFGE